MAAILLFPPPAVFQSPWVMVEYDAAVTSGVPIYILDFDRRAVATPAMRWATLGKGFNEIIAGEFVETQPPAAQMLYLCACLATAAQFSFSKQQLLACSSVTPAETLAYIQYNLKDIVIPSDTELDFALASIFSRAKTPDERPSGVRPKGHQRPSELVGFSRLV